MSQDKGIYILECPEQGYSYDGKVFLEYRVAVATAIENIFDTEEGPRWIREYFGNAEKLTSRFEAMVQAFDFEDQMNYLGSPPEHGIRSIRVIYNPF